MTSLPARNTWNSYSDDVSLWHRNTKPASDGSMLTVDAVGPEQMSFLTADVDGTQCRLGPATHARANIVALQCWTSKMSPDSVGRQCRSACRPVCPGLNRFLSICNTVVCCMLNGSCSRCSECDPICLSSWNSNEVTPKMDAKYKRSRLN